VFCNGQGAAIEVKLTEHGSTTLPLVADHTTHGVYLERIGRSVRAKDASRIKDLVGGVTPVPQPKRGEFWSYRRFDGVVQVELLHKNVLYCVSARVAIANLTVLGPSALSTNFGQRQAMFYVQLFILKARNMMNIPSAIITHSWLRL
jgi:hypothetical protein